MKLALLPKRQAAIGLVAGTILVTRSAQTTYAADKPVHSSIVTLGLCGIVELALSRLLSRETPHDVGKHAHAAVSLQEVRPSFEADEEGREPVQELAQPVSLRRLRVCFLVLVITLCLRAGVLHGVLKNVQCSSRSWAPLVPLALAAEEWWRVRRRGWRGRRWRSVDLDNDDEDVSAYEAFAKFVTRLPISGCVSAGMVGFGSILALGATASPRSTYVCAATLPYRLQVPHLQLVGVCLDVVVVWCVGKLLTVHASPKSLAGRAAAVGWASLLSSALLLLFGFVYYVVEEADRIWIRQISQNYVWSLLRLDLYIVFTLLCASALILHVGVLTTTLLTTFTSVLTITTVSAWTNTHAFPPSHLGVGVFAVAITIIGLVTYTHWEPSSKSTPSLLPRGVPIWLHLLLLTVFLAWSTMFFAKSTTVTYHPIDMLIYQAQARHETFLGQAFTSKTLSRATQVYKHRYHRHPPPGFDRWHEYAIAKNSVILDDFDAIHRDLLPFHALAPHVIRERTWELISNPWNDAAGLRIRDGKASVMDNGLPGTHAWMLDGLVEMIGNFVQWLPDMDLAFNINDECRVVVPYEHIEPITRVAEDQLQGFDESSSPKQKQFSNGRKEGWRELSQERNRETPLHEKSKQRIFESHGAMGCAPSSAARTLRTWDTSSLCTNCMSPHSLGAFLSNWTLAGDVCHQPDLADLHGIYLSPAAFKATHELYPFFSQSKVGGFNDILYPSAWNYMKKVEYKPTEEHPDIPWTDKKDVLFWRGATSEGLSIGRGQWKGMARQRFVELFSSGSAAPSVGLLPVGGAIPPNTTDSNGRPVVHHKLGYTDLPAQKAGAADVHVVDAIARCAGRDCQDQTHALAPLVGGIDFQEHWQHKYLLDLDGAGFSGRFLPFLQSGSLPLKAGLFREWWHGRIGEWKHFVPIDVRGVGVRATLAFFTQEGNDVAGERIAKDGKEWAEKVLRREDMEVYMFRLLLEWGRLTDDRRDELGYGK